MGENNCTYCGAPHSSQREHVIPVVWYGYRTYENNRQWIVPSCKDCNFLSGDKVFFSIPEKARYIAKRYKSRFRKILNTPFWSDEELSEIGYKLRAPIQEAMLQKNIIQKRIRYLESISEMSHDYERPEWVEKDLKKMEREYLALKRALSKKKNAKDTTKKRNKTT